MEKKKYICPAMETIEVDGESLMLTISGEPGEEVDSGSNAAPAYWGAWDSNDGEEE